MNTKNLKSSKLKKMLQDCGLIEGVSTPPFRVSGAKQISLAVMDLLYKSVCHAVGHAKSVQNTLAVIQDCTILDQNRSMKMRADLRFSHKKSRPLSRQSRSGLRGRSAHSQSGFTSQRSRKDAPGSRSQINLLRSITPSQRAENTFRSDFSSPAYMSSTMRPADRSGSCSARSPARDKFDFPCFVAFLIKLGPRVFPKMKDMKQAVLHTVEQFILPLLSK